MQNYNLAIPIVDKLAEIALKFDIKSIKNYEDGHITLMVDRYQFGTGLQYTLSTIRLGLYRDFKTKRDQALFYQDASGCDYLTFIDLADPDAFQKIENLLASSKQRIGDKLVGIL